MNIVVQVILKSCKCDLFIEKIIEKIKIKKLRSVVRAESILYGEKIVYQVLEIELASTNW